jgi:excinuclease ABC subunit A
MEEPPKLARRSNHDISIYVERKLVVREDNRQRIADSVETALRAADGVVEVVAHADGAEPPTHLLSEHYACALCGINIPELGAAAVLLQLPVRRVHRVRRAGDAQEPNPELILADHSLSILEGVVLPWGVPRGTCAAPSCRGWRTRWSSTSTPPGRSSRRTCATSSSSARR